MTIRNGLIAAASTLALSALATGAIAGTVSATATASATIISPTTITKTQDMVFGSLIRPTSGTTTFTLDSNDTVTASTGPGAGSVVASTTSSAKFNIASQALINYTLAPTLTFTQSGLTNVTVGPVATTSGTPGQVPAAGTQEIRYGASFDVGIATTPQAYTGTLSVVVTYN